MDSYMNLFIQAVHLILDVLRRIRGIMCYVYGCSR